MWIAHSAVNMCCHPLIWIYCRRFPELAHIALLSLPLRKRLFFNSAPPHFPPHTIPLQHLWRHPLTVQTTFRSAEQSGIGTPWATTYINCHYWKQLHEVTPTLCSSRSCSKFERPEIQRVSYGNVQIKAGTPSNVPLRIVLRPLEADEFEHYTEGVKASCPCSAPHMPSFAAVLCFNSFPSNY